MTVEAIRDDVARDVPTPKGLPLVGNTFEMAKDPGRYFLRCYRELGPVFKVNVFGRQSYVIAGTEAALFLSTKNGREALISEPFWKEFIDYHNASKGLVALDGPQHQEMRAIMRAGFSRDAVKGRYHQLIATTDDSIDTNWTTTMEKGVVEAFQYMIVQALGEILTGSAPLEYVRDIRVNILFLLNVLVTRQRPKFFLLNPAFKKARRRFEELSDEMIKEFKGHADAGTLPDNLLGDIMRTHMEKPDLIQERDL